jgi:hypothetical protein
MEVVTPGPDATWRHPTRLELSAGILLAATVILHVVAMIPTYFATPGGHASLFSQADQAAAYSILAAGWALALGVGLTGPSRIPISAGLATGLAVTEFGFRVSDVGAIIRYGSDLAGAGLWIMVAAWVVGVAAAAVLVVAARRRSRRIAGTPPVEPAGEHAPGLGEDVVVTGSTLWPGSDGAAGLAHTTQAQGVQAHQVQEHQVQAHQVQAHQVQAHQVQAHQVAVSPATAELPPATGLPAATAEEPVAARSDPALSPILWTLLLGLLGLITALCFLPAWDHYVGVTSAGRTFSFNLGNAFSGPWQIVLGNVLVALAIVAIPIAGSRLRDRGAAAAAVGGSLIVLGSQFVSAVVQVDQPVTITAIPARYLELGTQFGIKLTGWFTIDVLAAFGLFAAVMVWATSRVVYANSRGTLPKAPEVRSEAMPSAS